MPGRIIAGSGAIAPGVLARIDGGSRLPASGVPGAGPSPGPPGPAAGLATGIRAARAGIVARCDAHAVLSPGYLRRAVETLSRTGAANVGGRQHPVGRTFFERAVALAMTTWLGAGGARYRLGGPEGPADTVYLGVFRRDRLDAVGGVDPAMVANEDYELNWRLRERGETVWFGPALAVAYRPRGTLARQYYRYGWWKSAMLRRHPFSLRVRQLAAPLLVLGLAVSPLLAWTSAAGAPRDVSAASRCWGSPTTGGAPGRGDGWSSARRPGATEPGAASGRAMVSEPPAHEPARAARGTERQAARALCLLWNHRKRGGVGTVLA